MTQVADISRKSVVASRRGIRVLFSSAGHQVHRVRCFREDADALGLDLVVVAADIAPDRSAVCREADIVEKVPRYCDSGFVPAMLTACRRHEVDLVIPQLDPELIIYSENRERFADAGTDVVVSGPQLIRIVRDKALTSRHLRVHGVSVPRTGMPRELCECAGRWRWPIILKPSAGSASKGVHVIDEPAAMPPLDKLKGYIAQELWRGREFTVNIFFDQSGHLRAAVPHERLEVRSGEVFKGITERHEDILKVAWKLGDSLPGARGPLCFQVIVTESGEIVVFEVNARFGGGYPLTHKAGARFSRWLLEEAAGLPSSASDDWKAGVLMLRYSDAFFTG